MMTTHMLMANFELYVLCQQVGTNQFSDGTILGINNKIDIWIRGHFCSDHIRLQRSQKVWKLKIVLLVSKSCRPFHNIFDFEL